MKKGGQITVFLAMIMMCISALLCAVTETARTAGARCYLRIAADSALDSVMAGYHRELWKKYRLLLREAEGEEELEEEFARYFNGYLEAAGWYPAKTASVSADRIVKITEDGGEHLLQQVTDYMEYGIWTLDFSAEEAGGIRDGIREAFALQEISGLYEGLTGQALKLERAVEALNDGQLAQGELAERGRQRLAAGDGEGFLRLGQELKRELEKVSGAVNRYEKEADRLHRELEEVYRKVQDRMEEMTPEMQAAAREEYERYRSYTAEDGARREEIEGLADLAEENGTLTAAVMEEAREVMDVISSWEGEEGEEPDEDSLWRPVREHMGRFRKKTLACAHGTADKEKQSLLENIRRLTGDGLLGLVLPEDAQIPGGAIASEPLPSESGEGKQKVGKTADSAVEALAESLITAQYCGQFFPHFLDAPEPGLSCQMEYLVNGEKEDRENLKGTAARLLALREGLNLVHILRDPAKRAQARELAAVIVGASGMLPLTEVMAVFIMGIWALGEAAADVRTLYAGGRVSLIKTGEEWRLSLDQLLELGRDGYAEAESSEWGLNYESYLKLLLLASEQEVLLYRMMDVIQDVIGRAEPGFLMERCGVRVEMTAETEAFHLFSAGGAQGSYRLEIRAGRSY